MDGIEFRLRCRHRHRHRLEQPNTRAEKHRCLVKCELVDQPRFEHLDDRVGATGDCDVLVARESGKFVSGAGLEFEDRAKPSSSGTARQRSRMDRSSNRRNTSAVTTSSTWRVSNGNRTGGRADRRGNERRSRLADHGVGENGNRQSRRLGSALAVCPQVLRSSGTQSLKPDGRTVARIALSP